MSEPTTTEKDPRGGRGSKGDPALIKEALSEATKTEEASLSPEVDFEKAEQEKENLLKELAGLRLRENQAEEARSSTAEISQGIREVQKKLFQINRELPGVDLIADQKRVEQIMGTLGPIAIIPEPAVNAEPPVVEEAPTPAPVIPEVVETPTIEVAPSVPEEVVPAVLEIKEPIEEAPAIVVPEITEPIKEENPVATQEIPKPSQIVTVPEIPEPKKEEALLVIPEIPKPVEKEVVPSPESPKADNENLRSAYDRAVERLRKSKGAGTVGQIPESTQASPSMPQEIVPTNPQILAVANQTLLGDMDTLLSTPGLFGLGSKKGSESPHWKDHQVGFAKQSVESVLNMGRDSFPNDGGKHFGIEDPVATRKMKNYLMQVSQQAEMIADPGEKIADYIKRATMSLVMRSLNKR